MNADLDAVIRLARDYKAACAKSDRASEVRMLLPPGSTRARVTTANARWMRAAEHRDRVYTALKEALMKAAAGL